MNTQAWPVISVRWIVALAIAAALLASVIFCSGLFIGDAMGRDGTLQQVATTNATGNSTNVTPTAAKTHDAPVTVLHLKGQGDTQTEAFTVSGTWRITFICSGTSDLMLDVYRTGDNSPTGDSLTHTCPIAPQTASASATFHDSGTFYLALFGTEESYDITVTDLPN